jgi:DNA modification methylase
VAHYYIVAVKEVIIRKSKMKSMNGKPNHLYYGDNLEVLRKYIKDESVDLCYIDPPFNSNRNYNQIYLNKGELDKAQAHAFIDTWTWDDEAINGYAAITTNEKNRFTVQTILLIEGLDKVLGRGGLLAYLVHITQRVTEIHRVLKPTGSFYLHCDPTASHYIKLVLDSIFLSCGGEFRNEIIWHYRKWAIKQSQFCSNHDVILFYSKTNEKGRVFNHPLMERAASTLKRFGNSKIVSAYDENGQRLPSTTEESDSEGVAMDDVWDIGRVPPIKQLYPTQKPEKLLDRIIEASSNRGDVVLDAYCGCGTTVESAERLGRNWIGIDITYQSISVILWRLEKSIGISCINNIELNGVPQDWETAKMLAQKEDDRSRKEFEKWAILFYSNNKARINEKKGGDGGIDGTALIQDREENGEIVNKRIIFSVKSDKTLVPAYISQLKGKMHDKSIVMGVFICLYEPTKGMIKEAKEMGTYKNALFGLEFPKLQIVTIRDMFDKGMRLNVPVLTMIKAAEAKEVDKDQITLDI